MEYFTKSSFGLFITRLFVQHFTTKAWESFMVLAYGWSLSKIRHTISNYIWLGGGTKYKHFSQCYVFIGTTFKCMVNKLWVIVIFYIDSLIAPDVRIELVVDGTIRKKSGKKIDGASNYRNGAGSARQEFRVLWSINFVYVMLQFRCMINGIEVKLAIPLGLRVYLKEKDATKLKRDHKTRSKLAREIIDFIANLLPHRRFLVKADGGYSTKEFLRDLPSNVDIIGRLPIDGRLFGLPPKRKKRQLGRTPSKGKDLGNPKEWITKRGWKKHPSEQGAWIKTVTGMWHSVMPGKQIKVVAVWRKNFTKKDKRSGKKELEAFFSTDLQLTETQILGGYQERWGVEIDIRDGYAYYGLGKDQCRKLDRIYGINTFKILMAACRSLWFIQQFENGHLDLKIYRPWYRKKTTPSQLDVISAAQEALYLERVFPVPRFFNDRSEIIRTPEKTRPKAA